jgi:hypothetical protein
VATSLIIGFFLLTPDFFVSFNFFRTFLVVQPASQKRLHTQNSARSSSSGNRSRKRRGMLILTVSRSCKLFNYFGRVPKRRRKKERKKRKRRYLFHFGAFWLFYYCATSQIDVATTLLPATTVLSIMHDHVCVYICSDPLLKRDDNDMDTSPPFSLLVIYLCIYFCFLYIPIQLAMRTGRRSRWCVQRRPKGGGGEGGGQRPTEKKGAS